MTKEGALLFVLILTEQTPARSLFELSLPVGGKSPSRIRVEKGSARQSKLISHRVMHACFNFFLSVYAML